MNKIFLILFCFSLVLCLSAQEQSKTVQAQVSGKPLNMTKSDFINKVTDYKENPGEWKYKGDKPAIIDFYASWCGPCRMLAPTLDNLAKEYEGKIYIYKVNIDKEEELAGLFRVSSIPALLFIPMEGQPQMALGVIPKSELKNAIDKFLLSDEKNTSAE